MTRWVDGGAISPAGSASGWPSRSRSASCSSSRSSRSLAAGAAGRAAHRLLRQPRSNRQRRPVAADPGQRRLRRALTGVTLRPASSSRSGSSSAPTTATATTADGGPIAGCQTGADCVYQRYLAEGKGPEFEAAGITTSATSRPFYWREQLGTAGTVFVLAPPRRPGRGRDLRHRPAEAGERGRGAPDPGANAGYGPKTLLTNESLAPRCEVLQYQTERRLSWHIVVRVSASSVGSCW